MPSRDFFKVKEQIMKLGLQLFTLITYMKKPGGLKAIPHNLRHTP